MLVTYRAIASVALGSAALVTIALMLAWRGLLARARQAAERGAATFLALAAASVALVVLGAKLLSISRFGVDLPFWDHWDGEGLLYAALDTKSLTWAEMVAPHNEHRILFTRVLAVVLEIINRQWDNRLQMVVNSFIHAAAALALLALVARTGRRWEVLFLAGVVSVVTGLPFARENVVWGFQSQFYLDVLFSVLGVGLTLQSRACSPGWWVGIACAGCSVLSIGSGALAPIVIALVTVVDGLRTRRPWRSFVTAIVPVGLLAMASALTVVRLPSSAPLGAHGAGEFVRSLGRAAAWPWVDQAWLAPLLWTPLGVLLWEFLRSREEDREGARVLLGLGVWVLANAGAMAVARGAGGAAPASRYMDILGVGLVANTAALVRCWGASDGWGSKMRRTLIAGWMALVAVGSARLIVPTVRIEMPAFAEVSRRQVENVRRFVATGDMAALRGKPNLHIPFPDPEFLGMMLRLPAIRDILPQSVRERPFQGPLTSLVDRVVRWGKSLLEMGALLASIAVLFAGIESWRIHPKKKAEAALVSGSPARR